MKMIFTPAIGSKAKKTLREKMKQWNLKKKVSMKIEEIAKEINSVIRGWFTYYGHYRRSALYAVAEDIDLQLVKYLKAKFKLRVGYNEAWKKLRKIREQEPRLFCHWYMLKSKSTRAV